MGKRGRNAVHSPRSGGEARIRADVISGCVRDRGGRWRKGKVQKKRSRNREEGTESNEALRGGLISGVQ